MGSSPRGSLKLNGIAVVEAATRSLEKYANGMGRYVACQFGVPTIPRPSELPSL
jgi:hypothetical protein